MKISISKFDGIAYPLYAFYKKPERIDYSLRCIHVYIEDNYYLLDDKSLQGNYLSRLLQLDDRVYFDVTCRNLQDIVSSRVKWGIDSKGVVHDLSKKQRFDTEFRQVVKFNEQYVWVKNISYPFKIYTKEKISLTTDIFAKIVKIQGEWYLLGFSYDKGPNTFVMI